MPEGVKNLKCIKYSLMTINSFGVIIGIFVVLFGLAYQTETFPGGYKGKETAGFAGLFIFFSLVGYCGASHQKLFLLVPYTAVIGLGLIVNVFRWVVKPQKTCLDAQAYVYIFLCGLFILLMAMGFLLVTRVRALAPAPSASSDKASNFTRSTSSSFITIPKFGSKK